MAITPTIQNYRLLNQWPIIMGESPWTFNQVSGVGDRAPLSERGKRLYVQPDRETIADGLLQALDMITNQLGYYYRPVYVTDEIILTNSGYPITHQTFSTRFKYLKAFGTRTTSEIESGVTVTGSDPDSSGVNQYMTLSVTFASADAVPDLEEIQVFFTTSDGADSAASEYYEIEPLTKTQSGATVTLKGHRSLFVKPSIWDKPYNEPNYNPENVNYADTETAGDFVTSVDVYRVYPNATGAVQFRIDPATQWDYSDLTSYITYNADVLSNVDARLGQFRTRFSSTSCPRYPIDRIKVSYLAGYPLDTNGRPDRLLTQAHVRLGNTLMSDQPESFSDQRLRKWEGDNQAIALNGQNMTVTPFGYTRGAQAAWNIVSMSRYSIPKSGAFGVL